MVTERVDLDQRAIGRDEEIVERVENRAGRLEEVALEVEVLGQLARLVGLQAERGIDLHAHDQLGRLVRDVLDVHAALGAGDDDRRLRFAVEHDGEVEFAHRVLRDRDHDLADQLARFAGLRGDQRLAQHLAGEFLDFLRRLDQLHAALEAVLERPLAATAGVNLRLDHEIGRLERPGDGLGLLRRAGDRAGRRGDAKFLHEFFGLVLVDVH